MAAPPPATAPAMIPALDEQRFRELFDLLPIAAFEMDLTGRLTYVNRNALESFGYTREDIARGVNVIEILVPGDRERAADRVRRRIAGEPAIYTEYTALRRDGSTFPAMIHSAVVRRDGRPALLQGYVVDLSEPRKAERTLQYRVEFERLIMGISAHLIGLSHDELDAGISSALGSIGKFMGVDRAYLFRYSADGASMSNTHEWTGEGVSAELDHLQGLPVSSMPWLDRELSGRGVVAIPAVAGLPAEAHTEHAEFVREGILSLVCVAMALRGRRVGFLGLDAVRAPRGWSDDEVALLKVVGELLTGALVRRDAESALRESETKYRALVETTETGFVIVDETGHVRDANQEYVRISGHRTLAEILGRSVMEWTDPRDRERNAREVARCFQEGTVRNLQVSYVGPSGVKIPVEINATIFEVGGRRLILSLTRDVAERTRLQDEMLRAEKLHSVGVLAGGIAHDFNNILTAVLGNISLLRMEPHPSGRQDELLVETEQAALRARDLTRQLLTFSRGGAPVRKVVGLGPSVRASATLALRGRATALDLRVPADLRAVDADEGQIGQVVSNLVLNASQAMAGGGVVVVEGGNRELRRGGRPTLAPGPYVVFSVADSGNGIPAEHLPHIFEPYFTTKQEGSGLGLAVCYSIVANHGGAIDVDSAPGRGSTFTVWLPAAAGVAEAAPSEPQPVPGTGRVLVMDDEDSVRTTALALLRSLGYQAAGAREGREALRLWQEARERGEPFDLAIMDLTVRGGLGGRETVQELHALDPGAKVIVSSGYHQDPVMSRHREHGFCEALVKPYSVVELSRTLARVLGKDVA